MLVGEVPEDLLESVVNHETMSVEEAAAHVFGRLNQRQREIDV